MCVAFRPLAPFHCRLQAVLPTTPGTCTLPAAGQTGSALLVSVSAAAATLPYDASACVSQRLSGLGAMLVTPGD